ncbi:MAG: T9SS type A sorting domain-containing protein [Candidatus Marinimicrobia bacterium]|nr:T9SS type A sorting domain-containing protein [Candidatus Neomarinimicrobiota bacterium]
MKYLFHLIHPMMYRIIKGIIGVIIAIVCLQAQSMNDTLYSVGELDGDIHYWYNQNWYLISNGSLDLIIGDGTDWDGYLNYSRAFISFDISQYNDPDSIESAFIGLYQFYSRGNDTVGAFPTFFNRPTGLVPCIFDHVIYGDSLEWEDWEAGDLGHPNTISSNIGFISNTPDYEWKYIDVTESVRADISENRLLSQYRIRFTIDHDDDTLVDNLGFRSAESNYWSGFGPRLIISPRQSTSIIDEPFPLPESIKLNCFPNPFNPVTILKYDIPENSYVNLTIYNLSGKVVTELVNRITSEGSQHTTWNGTDHKGREVPSGVYLYTLTAESIETKNIFTQSKKMVLLK